jgi:hypothetical protein
MDAMANATGAGYGRLLAVCIDSFRRAEAKIMAGLDNRFFFLVALKAKRAILILANQ